MIKLENQNWKLAKMKKTQKLSKLKFKNYLIDMNKYATLIINLILLKKQKSTKNLLKK